MIEVTRIPNQVLPVLWGSIQPLIEEAFEVGPRDETPADIAMAALRDECQIWVIADTSNGDYLAALVTKLIQYPTGRVLTLCYCSGRALKTWKDKLEERMIEFARHHECKAVDIVGRSGWGRAIKGMVPTTFTCRRELHQ